MKEIKKIVLFLVLIIAVSFVFIFFNEGDNNLPLRSSFQEKSLNPVSRTFIRENDLGVTVDINRSNKEIPPKIPQPNTTWNNKTIAINGKVRSYTFGSGNPIDLEVKKENFEAYLSTRLSDGSYPDGYVTPKVEMALKDFLENPSLPYFIEKCYKEISWYDDEGNQGNLFPHNLDIENILFINSITGRKELREQDVLTMLRAFDRLANPITHPGGWASCLSQVEMSQHLMPLQEQLLNAVGAYHSGD